MPVVNGCGGAVALENQGNVAAQVSSDQLPAARVSVDKTREVSDIVVVEQNIFPVFYLFKNLPGVKVTYLPGVEFRGAKVGGGILVFSEFRVETAPEALGVFFVEHDRFHCHLGPLPDNLNLSVDFFVGVVLKLIQLLVFILIS